MAGHLYILIEREMIRLQEPTLKIGKTVRTPHERLKGYPKESKLLGEVAVANCHVAEQCLIQVFKSKFVQETRYGIEYFSGNIKDMITTFFQTSIMFITEESANFYTLGTKLNDSPKQGDNITEQISESDTDNSSTNSQENSEPNYIQFLRHIKNDRPEWYTPNRFISKREIQNKYEELFGTISSKGFHNIFHKKNIWR